MKGLQVNNLVLYPRIKRSVKESLDDGRGLEVLEHSIPFTKRMEELHSLLIELLQACLDELKTQVKKLESVPGNVEEVLDAKKALLKSFFGKVRRMLGTNQLSFKARSLLRNVGEINRLIWLLINQEPVALLTYLNELRLNSAEEQFSLFLFSDDETMRLIEKIHKLAKERVYTVALKQPKAQSLEARYPELKGSFKEQFKALTCAAEAGVKNFEQFARDFEMVPRFESQPKMAAICKILQEMAPSDGVKKIRKS